MASEERTEVQIRLLLNDVIRKCTPAFKLLFVEYPPGPESSLSLIDGIRRFDFKHNGLAGKSLDKNLHGDEDDDMSSDAVLSGNNHTNTKI
jgi:hypothetical protein